MLFFFHYHVRFPIEAANSFHQTSTPQHNGKLPSLKKWIFMLILFQPHGNRRFLDFTQPGLWRFYRSTVTQNVALAARGAALGVRRSGRAKLSLLHGHRGSRSSGGGTDETGDSVERKMGNYGNKIVSQIVFTWKPEIFGT